MGKVVSPDYKVLGVDRLRVVDGSTFDESPGTNPQATVMMMGRYVHLDHDPEQTNVWIKFDYKSYYTTFQFACQ